MATEIIQPPPQRRIIGPQTNIYLHELTDVADAVKNAADGDTLVCEDGSWVAAPPAAGGSSPPRPSVFRLLASSVAFDGTPNTSWAYVSVPTYTSLASYRSMDDAITLTRPGVYRVTIRADVYSQANGLNVWPTVETMVGTMVTNRYKMTLIGGNDISRHHRSASSLTPLESDDGGAFNLTWIDQYILNATSDNVGNPSRFNIEFFAQVLQTLAESHFLNVELLVTVEWLGEPIPEV